MGNSQSQEVQDYEQLLAQYSVIKQFHDIRLGDLTILEEQTTKDEVLLREINANDEFEFSKTLKKFQDRKALIHPNIIELIGLTTKKEEQFCATFFKTYLLFQYVTNNLEREVNSRQTHMKPFTDGELSSLIKQSVDGMAFLQVHSIIHQNLRPNTIYITQKGTIKVTDPTSFQQTNNFGTLVTQGFESHKQYQIYISPLLLEAFNKNDYNPNHNPYKSDVFTLGMILLGSALLESLHFCYQEGGLQIDFAEIQKTLELLKSQFSPHNYTIIREMLIYDEQNRPDFIALQRKISHPDQKIPQTPKNEPLFVPPPIPTYHPPSPPVPRSEFQQPLPIAPHVAPVTPTISMYSTQRNDKPMSSAIHMNPERQDFAYNGLDIQGIPRDTFDQIPRPDENIINDIGQYGPSEHQSRSQVTKLSHNPSKSGIQDRKSVFSVPYHPGPTSIAPIPDIFNKEPEKKQNPNSDFIQRKELDQILQKYQKKETSSHHSFIPPTNSYINSVPPPPLSYHEPIPNSHQIPSFNLNPDYLNPQIDYKPPVENHSSQESHRNNPSASFPLVREYVIQHYQNGSKYEGEQLGITRDGSGQFFYQDGGMYDGDWVNNQMEGRGVLYYASGQPAYDGDWKEDLFSGRGVLYNENPQKLYGTFDYKDFDLVEDFWTKYDGQFQDDNKEGVGTLFFSNDEKFVGLFQADFINGPGTFYQNNGSQIKAVWRNNQISSQPFAR